MCIEKNGHLRELELNGEKVVIITPSAHLPLWIKWNKRLQHTFISGCKLQKVVCGSSHPTQRKSKKTTHFSEIPFWQFPFLRRSYVEVCQKTLHPVTLKPGKSSRATKYHSCCQRRLRSPWHTDPEPRISSHKMSTVRMTPDSSDSLSDSKISYVNSKVMSAWVKAVLLLLVNWWIS